MTEQVAEQVVEQDNEVKDPHGLLKAYNKLKDDVAELRVENKRLQSVVDETGEEAVNKWKDRAVKQAARSALEGEGIKDADRILKYITLEGVDFDDNDSITGLDEKLTDVRKDFPELFDKKRRAGSNSADIHQNEAPKRVLTPTEAQVARMFQR